MSAVSKFRSARTLVALLGVTALSCARADAPADTIARTPIEAAQNEAKNTGVDMLSIPRAMLRFAGQDFFHPLEDSELIQALERLIDDQLVQFDLRDNLKLECQLERYRTPNDEREVGMTIGLKYRF